MRLAGLVRTETLLVVVRLGKCSSSKYSSGCFLRPALAPVRHCAKREAGGRFRALSTPAHASMAASKPTDVRIATYNVLSSHLGGPDYYTACDPADLHPPTRLARVLDKLRAEVDQGAIVCLQEVSIAWAGPLHAFFQQRGYSFVTHLYSPAWQGFMGVGVAFDARRFEVVDCDISRISDAKKWPKPPPQGLLGRLLGMGWSTASSAFWAAAKLVGKRPPEDPIEQAKRRVNAMVFLRLREAASGATFGCATYHMPCAFRSPQTMAVHMALCGQRAFALAGTDPFVVCGDFNIQPDSDFYRFFQTGRYERNCPSFPALPAHDPWQPDLPAPLRSAYAEAHDAEPDFTNYAKIRDDEPFIGTLDYIFLRDGASSRWEVAAADALPHRNAVKGPYPNPQEPSDHAKVSAKLRLLPGAA